MVKRILLAIILSSFLLSGIKDEECVFIAGEDDAIEWNNYQDQNIAL